jgi:hypothetical protein
VFICGDHLAGLRPRDRLDLPGLHFTQTARDFDRPGCFGIVVNDVVEAVDQRSGQSRSLCIRQPHRVIQQLL